MWLTNTISRSFLRPGTNLLAAKIHQQSLSSSDVAFDFGLSAMVVPPGEPKLSLMHGGPGFR